MQAVPALWMKRLSSEAPHTASLSTDESIQACDSSSTKRVTDLSWIQRKTFSPPRA